MNRVICVLAIVGIASGSAFADNYTTVTPSGEPSIQQIINDSYGSGFVADGLNYTKTSTNTSFVRVMDHDASDGTSPISDLLIHNFATSQTDQIWHDGTVEMKAQAKYAGNNQNFGIVLGADGSGATLPGVLTAAGQSMTFGPVSGGQFLLYDHTPGGSDAQTWYSLESKNTDDLDHMVTYAKQVNGITQAFLVCFEDLPNSQSDHDYNDFVVEITVVPLPPATWAGLSTLAGVAGLGYIRRRRLS